MWVLLSLLLYWAAALGSARLRGKRDGGRLGRLLETYEDRPWAWLLLQAFKLAYFLGLPYGALMQGAISPHWMGLVHFDLYASLGMGGLLTAGALVLLSLDWWIYLRSLNRSSDDLNLPILRYGSGGTGNSAGFASGLMEVLLLEAHWAFYRGACATFFGDYAGAFLGVALVGAEWLVRVGASGLAGRPAERENFLHRATLAFTIAVIYVYTRNFWVCLVAHAVLHLGLVRWVRFWAKRYGRRESYGLKPGLARAGLEPGGSQADRQRHGDQHTEHHGRQNADPLEV